MTPEPNGPADTTMMRIVHQALRRDLDRATTALTASPPPPERQRVAIARHLVWMMSFLHDHHAAEDDGLYPLVRERRPGAADVLDEMERDHQTIADGIRDVVTTANAYGESDGAGAREASTTAIARLCAVLLPHLRREEEVVMPIVSDAMTHAEWLAIEREHNLDPKSMRQLGFEGHWLIDDADDADRATVTGLVPAVPRFFLLHGMARSYRRRHDACWSAEPTRRVQKHGRTAVEVPFSVDAVWDVVRDPTRVGEWSHECVDCSYLDGATEAAPGVRFRRRNRQSLFRWGRVCEVVSSESPELVWRTVPTAMYPDSTVWRIRVAAVDGGTRIEQSFDVVKAPKLLDPIFATVLPAHRDRTAALQADLRRLGALAVETDPEPVARAS